MRKHRASTRFNNFRQGGCKRLNKNHLESTRIHRLQQGLESGSDHGIGFPPIFSTASTSIPPKQFLGADNPRFWAGTYQRYAQQPGMTFLSNERFRPYVA